MILITLISASEFKSLVFMVTKSLNLNFVDIVRIRLEPLPIYQTLKLTIHKSIEGAPSETIGASSSLSV